MYSFSHAACWSGSEEIIQKGLRHVLGSHEPHRGVEISGRAQLPVHLPAQHVVAPLLVRTLGGFRLGTRPVQANLHEQRLAFAPTPPERLDHPSDLLGLAA